MAKLKLCRVCHRPKIGRHRKDKFKEKDGESFEDRLVRITKWYSEVCDAEWRAENTLAPADAECPMIGYKRLRDAIQVAIRDIVAAKAGTAAKDLRKAIL